MKHKVVNVPTKAYSRITSLPIIILPKGISFHSLNLPHVTRGGCKEMSSILADQ